MDKKTVENDRWNRFFQLAAISALLIVVVGLTDTITSMISGETRENLSIDIVDWFIMLQTHRFAALGNLGFFNILTLSLGIPVYLALCRLHWTTDPGQAALALTLFVLGVGIYISSNTIFALMALSDQYATASAMQRPVLEQAGQALLARGADLSAGTFMGFFFTQCAGLLMTFVVLRGGVFSKTLASLGLAGFTVMSIFFVMAAFVPAQFVTAMIISAPGGLLLIVYHILLARRLFQLAV